ncbi:MAG: 8-oxoguanine DNA glycosylase OGG fold protein [Acidimicrobiales bacterium]
MNGAAARIADAAAGFQAMLQANPWLGGVIQVGGPPLTRLGCFIGRPWREMASGLSDTQLEAAVRATVDRCPNVPGADVDSWRYIDRGLLLGLSRSARSCDDDLVQLWVATMIWGSIRDNGGPSKVAAALGSNYADVVTRLRKTLDLLDAGNLVDAYSYCMYKGGSYLPKIGDSYFTKWLWAGGLGAHPTLSPTPLILDDRARAAALSCGPSWAPIGSNDAKRWVDYCELGQAVAADLTPTLGALDAEKIEYALYCVGG